MHSVSFYIGCIDQLACCIPPLAACWVICKPHIMGNEHIVEQNSFLLLQVCTAYFQVSHVVFVCCNSRAYMIHITSYHVSSVYVYIFLLVLAHALSWLGCDSVYGSQACPAPLQKGARQAFNFSLWFWWHRALRLQLAPWRNCPIKGVCRVMERGGQMSF